MRAVVCQQLGSLSDLVVEDRERLQPGPGQVVIDVRAAGVNYVDGLLCLGRYQIKPPTPFIPGGEVAGNVSAVGEGVNAVPIGGSAIAITGLGAFAEQVVVPAGAVLAIPPGVEFGRAAALIQSYGTAMFALTRRTSVQPREWVLVLGAGGGVGLAMVDVAVALGGRVIAAASSQEKLSAAQAMGAEATIAYEHEDLKSRARELSGGGVDVVVDVVGGRHSEPALRATGPFGRVCVIGFAAGPIASVPLNQVLLNNRTIVGVDWGAWAFRQPEANRALIAELLDLVGKGSLHPTIPAERPLEDAGRVMTELLERRVTGKVVLVP